MDTKTEQEPISEREQQKRSIAVEQIIANMMEPTRPSHKKDAIGRRIIHPVNKFSTKMLTTADQLLLAVDKIDYPEFKAGLLPSMKQSHVDGLYDYESIFSMNGGDKMALAIMLNKIGRGKRLMFSPMDGTYEIEARMSAGNANEITYEFIRRINDDTHIKAMKTRMTLTKKLSDNGEFIPVWIYAIGCRCDSDEGPRETELKPKYNEMQLNMRAILSSLGIVPSKISSKISHEMTVRKETDNE